ncbi:MAG: RNA polymerase subunit sigma-70 [Cytophagales bacterium CG12_big_fil_rev_8_21_14_0_65_40_12]|nr:MAG: RNA polymerase subunit sigma-70 [Cytophagales bacterium CG12_big_fil_rev_8_21_14_0_65_40_12]PIW05367.1 MAG: RNA polymerase subunit sigma-70 [Cytophagales bacterium CG17_big_fil_post_rev_8_21_14_2_50_40_13]
MLEKENTSVCKESVFDSIFRQVAPSLKSFLYFKFKDEIRAQDMVQEAFLILWKNCAKVLPEAAKSYLYRVAQNQMLKLVDHDKVKNKYIEFYTESSGPEDPQYGLEYTEFEGQIMKAINDLPEGQREVFLMNRVEKMTYAEIAISLDLSVKAIEKRMHLALKQIRLTYKDI